MEPIQRGVDDLDQYMVPDQEQPEPEPPDEPEPEPEPEEETRKTAGPGAFSCPTCGREFDSQRGLARHVTDIHGRPGRPPTSSQNPRSSGRRAAGRPQGPKPVQPPRRRGSSVQTGLFLCYRLAGAAFATFGPEPQMARQIVGASMTMTAGPAAGGLDRVAKRTPFYGLLDTLFSGAGVLEDLTPLGVPLFLGVYGYSSAQVRERIRPMVQESLTVLFAQIYGVEMPVEQAATEATMGIEPTPEGMRQMAEGLLQGLDMGAVPEPNHAAAAPAA